MNINSTNRLSALPFLRNSPQISKDAPKTPEVADPEPFTNPISSLLSNQQVASSRFKRAGYGNALKPGTDQATKVTGLGTVTNSGISLSTLNIENTDSIIFERSTTINYGKLVQRTNNDFSDSVKIQNGATLDIGGLGFNTGSTAANNGAANAKPSIGNTKHGIFLGSIQDGNEKTDLIKVATGTQTFSSTNAYSGPTTITNERVLTQGVEKALSANSNMTVSDGINWIWEGVAELLETLFKLTEPIVENLTRFFHKD